MALNILLLITLITVVCEVSVRAQTCVTSSTTGGLRLGVESHRNSTGHWSYKIGLLKIDENSKSVKSDYWTLDVQNCRDSRLSILNITITSTNPSSPPATASVARFRHAGYSVVPDIGNYKIHTELVSWQRAKEICEEEEAHLVIVETDKEAQALVNLLNTTPKPTSGATYNDYIWIGTYQFGVKGQPWRNIFGDVLQSTAKQEDAYLTVENVAGLLQRINGKLSWSQKNANQPFICEEYS